MMQGKDIVKLAADLGAGYITEQAIQAKYGSAILALVLAAGAGYAVNSALDAIDEETGIISDIGGVVDDILSIF
jgi:hypothetical protein